MSTLKQGTLSFTSTKRTSSNPTAKFKSKSKKGYRESYARSVSVGSVSVSSAATSEPETVTDGGQVVNSEVEEEIHVQPPMKKLRLDDSKGRARPLSHSKSPGKKRKEGLDMEDESGKWRKHWGVVRQKMGYMEPIHKGTQTKIHAILRVFDLSYEYGPCIGVTRLERWERAQALGLNPPIEVREILEASEQDELAYSVFTGEV